ncbi:hypothetical protein BDR06DRAFT_966798 [Suillus hirtellus]|nr:hypothetical protein BDR06DRAFT_966798 [Suillus hirtellus]
MDEFLTNFGTQITYCAPQEIVAIDFDTRLKHTTCQVPVMEGWQLRGLLAVEELVSLSYNMEPGEERVNILNKWKVQMLWDWFYMTHSEAIADGPKFICADPDSTQNKAFSKEEDGWDILSPPEDANLWIHGRIKGLDDTFEKTIKFQALQELSKPSQFFETQYQEGTILLEWWHKGHTPHPFFWSNKWWDWFCEGNDYWKTPIDLLHYVLVTEPAYHEVDQFLDDQNPFNTLELFLLFKGYMHQKKMNSEGQQADNSILWQSLNQISTQEHRLVWEWVCMLNQAGDWWQEFKHKQVKSSQVEMHITEHDNCNGNVADADQLDNNVAQSSQPSPLLLHSQVNTREMSTAGTANSLSHPFCIIEVS